MTEISAVQTMVEIAISLDIPRVVIESDSLKVTRLLSSHDVCSHPYSDLAQYIYQLQLEHGAMAFQHTLKKENSIVDLLCSHWVPLSLWRIS